ncbi:cyclophilin-like fold protein [soil metagenome]
MRILITLAGDIVATGTLDNNDSARDFAALLPLDLLLKDYASTEKIADLPGRLSMTGAPAAYTPSAGDISFYSPWGNLAIFYKDGHLSSGLVRFGRLDSGIDAMRRIGPLAVRVALAAP